MEYAKVLSVWSLEYLTLSQATDLLGSDVVPLTTFLFLEEKSLHLEGIFNMTNGDSRVHSFKEKQRNHFPTRCISRGILEFYLRIYYNKILKVKFP